MPTIRRRERAVPSACAALVAAGAVAALAEPEKVPKPEPDLATKSARVELGRRLFHEPGVSRGGRFSCASCHDPDHGFTDRAHPSIDDSGPMHRRSMPLADLTTDRAAKPMHSDGEFESVRDLLDARLAPFELLDTDDQLAVLASFGIQPSPYDVTGSPPLLVRVADRLVSEARYSRAFTAAYGDADATHDRVAEALDAYTTSLRSTTSPFDRYQAGDDAAMTPAAVRGMMLFEDRAGCSACHLTQRESGRAPLRDGLFHDTGISVRTARLTDVKHPTERGDPGLGAHGENLRERRRERGRFKTPSLRDVARRGPYMHDGSLATLADVVEHYDRGGERHGKLDPKLRPLGLSAEEKDDLLAFLFSLSGDERPGLVPAPDRGTGGFRVRVVDIEGRPLAGARVAVEAAGERFRDAASRPAGTIFTTTADGTGEFLFPRTTHVRLHIEGHGTADGSLLPDCADGAEVVAVPSGRVALRTRFGRGDLPRTVRAVPIAKLDRIGRVTVPREGDTVTFRFVRTLSSQEGLYVAEAPPEGRPDAQTFVVPGGGGSAVSGVASIDLRAGAMDGVDVTVNPAALKRAR